MPLTGLTAGQIHTVDTLTRHRQPPPAGRPWALPLSARLLLVLIHLRTNLTSPAPATHFDSSQSAVDRIIYHLVPALARTLRPDPDNSSHPWLIDGTLTTLHDQPITAISNNYRRSVNAQIIICAHRRRVVVAGKCWPGDRNEVVVARATAAHLLTGQRRIHGDDGDRGIAAITAPLPDSAGRIIRDHRYRTHRRIRTRVEHVIARLKDRQIPRQRRRHGHAINHSLQIIAGPWNLKTCSQSRVTS